MAGGFSAWLENDILERYLRASGAVYVSLHVSDPGDNAGPGEVSSSGTGYERQEISFGSPSNGSATNDAVVTYDPASTDWGTVTHFGIWDAVTAGHLLWYGPLIGSKPMTTGDVFRFNTGQVTCSAE